MLSFLSMIEIILHIKRGPVALEPDAAQFNYQYVEIYKDLFRKARLSDGSVVYKTQRHMALDQSFPEHKGKNTKRIFVLGGSVAQSLFIKDATYFWKLFKSRDPEEKFEVICCGMPCYDSYRELLIQKEIVNYNPDLIILMSGNNEFFTSVRINLWAYRSNKFLRNFWVYRLPQDKLIEYFRNHGKCGQVTSDIRLANFKNNIRSMIRMAKKKNIAMAVCTLPANFRDCPPEIGDIPLENRQFFLGWVALNERNYEEAKKCFWQFIDTHPKNAFGHYFLAKCYDALGRYPEAQEYYLKALDLEDGGNRCQPERNRVIRRLSKEEAVAEVDLERFFIGIAPHGLVGKELFFEQCHWWEEYDSCVYKEIFRSLVEYHKLHLTSSPAFLSNLQGDFDSRSCQPYEGTRSKERALRMVLYVVPHIRPQIRQYSDDIHFINERAITFLVTAVKFDPELFNSIPSLKGRILNGVSDNWWIKDIMPDLDDIWISLTCHIGEAFRRLGKYDKAIEYFSETIRLNPRICFAYLGRGLAYYRLGRIAETKDDFEEITKISCRHTLTDSYRQYLGF